MDGARWDVNRLAAKKEKGQTTTTTTMSLCSLVGCLSSRENVVSNAISRRGRGQGRGKNREFRVSLQFLFSFFFLLETSDFFLFTIHRRLIILSSPRRVRDD